jgi:methyltransferase (TIGR00027 family)
VRPFQVSLTAQRVAARRVHFARVPADHGDPDADDRLGRDVAGSVVVDSQGALSRYLQARTGFFDRVVVASLARGVTQVVIAAAGYDGRALRYAKPGVRWFEVDHPATQADKVDRLARLGLAAPQIAFVAADFAVDDVAAGLAAAGHDAETPTLFLCEGVAVYLDRGVLEGLLRALRSRAEAGGLLAISLSVSDVETERRARFDAGVAALGEPVRTVLTAAAADQVLTATGWRRRDEPPGPGAERRARAGFVVAVPV